MEKEEIKKIQRTAQKLLEQLQGTNATFLFIGDEGNCFTVSGDQVNIEAQLMLAMIRYPVVRDIVHNCSTKYKVLNNRLGENIRNLKMEHLIEINSGNPGTER